MNYSINYFYIVSVTAFCAATLLAASGCGGSQDPDAKNANITPAFYPVVAGTSEGSSGERGNMAITEIGYAGSICNVGGKEVYDPEDVFIELQSKHFRKVNVSGWRLNISGDFNKSFIIPKTDKVIPTNGFFVIAAKKDGAFKADVYIPGLKLGKHFVKIELRDIGNKLINDAGSTSEEVFAGGYDLVTTRSMELTNVIFGNQGTLARNWHSYSDDNNDGNQTDNIKQACKARTLASPGEGSTSDYSGNSNSGNFS